MNRHLKRRAIALRVCLSILTGLLFAACDRTTEKTDLPRVDRRDLVTEADVVFHCSDSSALMEAMAQSPLGRLWNGPEMAAFRDGRSLPEIIGTAMPEEDMDADRAARIRDLYLEQIKLLAGEIVLGLDCGDFTGQPAITLAAAMRAEDYRRSLEMDALIFELEETETLTASEDFRGTPVTTYLRKETGADRFIYQAFHEGTLLVSEDRSWLEQALIRLMAASVREPAGDPVFTLTGTARLMDRLQTFLAAKAAERSSPVDIRTVVHSLGLDAVGDMGLEVRLGDDRAEMAFRVARRGPWDRGLMVLIPAEPAPADLRLAHVPPDAAGYQVFRLDLNALWRQMPDILGRIAPEFQTQFSMGVDAVGGMMNLDLGEDLFGNLERLVFTYVRLGDQGQEMVYGFRVKDAAAMERTLDKLFAEHSPVLARMGEAYQRSDIQGRIVHLLRFPVPTGRGDETTFGEIGLAVADRALLIGPGRLVVDHVQAAVHDQGEPAFYTGAMFTTMAARIPADACSYGVSDFAAYARFVVDELRSALATVQEALATPAGGASKAPGRNPVIDGLTAFNPERLPSSAAVAAYFGNGEAFSVIDDKGLRSTLTIHYPRR